MDIACTVNSTTKFATLIYKNEGASGVVFHVYDRLHPDRIPRCYTVEEGHSLDDQWATDADDGHYDLWVTGPNGYLRHWAEQLIVGEPVPVFSLAYHRRPAVIELKVEQNDGARPPATVAANAYRSDGPWLLDGARKNRRWSLAKSHGWYDFTAKSGGHSMRFAGRLETGSDSFSDPAI